MISYETYKEIDDCELYSTERERGREREGERERVREREGERERGREREGEGGRERERERAKHAKKHTFIAESEHLSSAFSP